MTLWKPVLTRRTPPQAWAGTVTTGRGGHQWEILNCWQGRSYGQLGTPTPRPRVKRSDNLNLSLHLHTWLFSPGHLSSTSPPPAGSSLSPSPLRSTSSAPCPATLLPLATGLHSSRPPGPSGPSTRPPPSGCTLAEGLTQKGPVLQVCSEPPGMASKQSPVHLKLI